MPTPFQLTVATPEKIFFDGDTTQIIVRTTEGDIGILANHANLLAGIDGGKLIIMTDGKSLTFKLSRGFIRVGGGSAVIIADSAE